MGTQMFAAPEVFLSDDESAYTNAVDIWSAGVITLLTLVGMPNMNFKSVLKYAVRPTEPFPYQPLISQNVSTEGQAFVRALLEREGKVRPSASRCLQFTWLSHANSIPQNLGRTNGQQNEISEQERMPIRRSAVSSDGLDGRAQPIMSDPAALTSQSTGSLMPTAEWSTYKSDSSPNFETVSGYSTVRPGSQTLPNSKQDSTSSVSDTPRRSQQVPGVHEPLSSTTIRAGESRQKEAYSSSRTTDLSKDISPDTPITIKVNIDRKLEKIVLPLKDLEPDMFLSKVCTCAKQRGAGRIIIVG